jgi:protein gp37
MNKSNIDWCTHTINPIVGCLHNCFYCYAKEMVEHGRLKQQYNGSFEPRYFPERLKDINQGNGRKIFVCSMSDMFGEWVSKEWIEQILKSITNKSNTYLFLTKNPNRYNKFIDLFQDNMMIGITVARQNMFRRNQIENLIELKNYNNKIKIFISIEPFFINTNIDVLYIKKGIDWVIIGGMTGKYAKDYSINRYRYNEIINQCINNNIPVFVKNNAKMLNSPKMYWHDRY